MISSNQLFQTCNHPLLTLQSRFKIFNSKSTSKMGAQIKYYSSLRPPTYFHIEKGTLVSFGLDASIFKTS